LNYIAKQFLKVFLYYRKVLMAAGYDLSSNNTYRLMKGRLGIYDKRPFNPNTNSVSGVAD
jgi:hypothetical protein